VIPHEHVPALLRHAPRLALEPVLSRRARWLAAMVGADWATEGDVSERWELGSRSTRLHLAHVHPDEVAPLLVAGWRQESAADREAFLEVLGPALDEAFLETALDDRAQGVRQQAAILLSRRPESAFAHRMQARLAGDELPAFDESMRRDGLEPGRLRRQIVEAVARAAPPQAVEPEPDKDGAPPQGRWSAGFTGQVAAWDDAPRRWQHALGVHGHPDLQLDPHTEAGALLAFRRTMLEELRR
jgi:hypothetical protein